MESISEVVEDFSENSVNQSFESRRAVAGRVNVPKLAYLGDEASFDEIDVLNTGETPARRAV